MQLFRRSRLTETGCWEWTGFRRPRMGYGLIVRHGKVQSVHRVAWALHCGPIPAGMHVLHRCDNPPCWNPDHLFLGTDQDNSDDKRRKGRARHVSGEQHPQARITLDIAQQIRAAWRAGSTQADIARQFNVNRGTVHFITTNKQWKDPANG